MRESSACLHRNNWSFVTYRTWVAFGRLQTSMRAQPSDGASPRNCFAVNSLQKLHHPFTLSPEFNYRDCVFHWTKVIHHYSFLFAAYHWINPTSQRSVVIYLATVFRDVIEDAESMVTLEFGETMLVITYKVLSVMSYPFQTFNVCIREQHFGFFTTYSATRTMHEQVST